MAIANFNDTTPTAPTGRQNVKWRGDASAPRNISSNIPNVGGVNLQTGTSYTIQLSDQGKLVSFDSASPISVIAPEPASPATITAGFFCAVENRGGGTLTITAGLSPLTSTIDDVTNLAIATNQGCWLFFDGTNWYTERGVGLVSSANGGGSWYQQVPIGIRDGVNKDFFLDFVPSSAPTGIPPRVPFSLFVNGIEQDAYRPDYYLAPGSKHLQMVAAPKAVDWGWQCRYMAGQETGISVPPTTTGNGAGPGTPPGVSSGSASVTAIQSPGGSSIVNVLPGGATISVSLALSPNLAGSTLIVFASVFGQTLLSTSNPRVTDTNNSARPYTDAASADEASGFLPGVGVFFLENVAAGANTVTFAVDASNTNPIFALDFRLAILVLEIPNFTAPIVQDSGTQQSNDPGGLVSVDLTDSHAATITTAMNTTPYGAIAVADLLYGGADLFLAAVAMNNPTPPTAPTGTGLTYQSLGYVQDSVTHNYLLAAYCKTLPLTVATSVPVVSPAGATFPDALHTVSLSAPAGYTIYFTTDGSTPTAASRTYISSILIPESLTVKAISVDSAGTVSAVTTASFTVAPGLPSVPGAAGSAKICWLLSGSSNAYTNVLDSGKYSWLNAHIDRIIGFTTYWDSRLSGFANSWFYRDVSALYHPGDDSLIGSNPSWIYRDSAGRPLYIKWGAQWSDGTYPQYAADHGNADFRAWWIAQATATFAAGYTGLFIDDVNLDANYANQFGDQRPIDPRTGELITDANHQKYLVEFLEAIRTAFPGVEIAHNAIYYNAGGNPSANPYLTRQIQACDLQNFERGFSDSGIVAGFGTYGLEHIFDIIDQIHGLSRNFIAMQNTKVQDADYYPLACFFLVTDGNDLYEVEIGGDPTAWAAINYVDLGAASGARYAWNGLLRRDFANGVVLVAQPGTSGGGDLGSTYTDPAGNSVSSVTLGGRQGIILVS